MSKFTLSYNTHLYKNIFNNLKISNAGSVSESGIFWVGVIKLR